MITDYVKKVQPFNKDERGLLANLSDPNHRFPIAEVVWMESKKGSVRANHYHKHDIHTIYLLTGKCEYITKDMKNPSTPIERTIVNAGEIVTSPSMIAHKLVFLEDSLGLFITTEPRDREHYESDTVRLEVDQ